MNPGGEFKNLRRWKGTRFSIKILPFSRKAPGSEPFPSLESFKKEVGGLSKILSMC